jgi:hypothetical protein
VKPDHGVLTEGQLNKRKIRKLERDPLRIAKAPELACRIERNSDVLRENSQIEEGLTLGFPEQGETAPDRRCHGEIAPLGILEV